MEYFRQRFIDELNEPGDIEIAGLVWSRHDVLATMEVVGEREHFRNWVDGAKQLAKERVREFLTETRCLDRFRTLTSRYQQGNVVPFIGAGMSVPSGFRPWGDFLRTLVADMPDTLIAMNAALALGEFEEAAQIAWAGLGSRIFDEEIINQLGPHLVNARGPVQLLPLVFKEEVLTTNLDYLLPVTYEEAGHPFTTVLCGPDLAESRRRIGNNPHALLRMHGQGDTNLGRVVTFDEYQAAYGPKSPLSAVLSAIIGTKSLLFMGSSLQFDRTVIALKTLRREAVIAPPRHYAFLPQPPEGRRAARRMELGEAEIHPIYYPAESHDQCIEDLLITLMEGGLDD